MKEYLIFRLYGPMASWGDIAVGETRPSGTHPSKSAMMGLVAAALGIPRDEETTHRKMAESYGFAIRVDAVGTPLADYHTAQVPGGKKIFFTRKDEITSVPRSGLKTILSRRDYRMDAMYTVALWVKADPPFPLAGLADALEHPKYTLYLGRKSCPLALPAEPQVVRMSTLREAFENAIFSDLEELNCFKQTGGQAYFWEDGVDAGMTPQHAFERRDVTLSRLRWQFEVRLEYHCRHSEEE